MTNKGVEQIKFFNTYSLSIPKSSVKKYQDNKFTIPLYTQSSHIITNNYKVTQLKMICKKYKIKSTGNKEEIRNRIYNYLRLSNYAIIIQRALIRYIVKVYNSLRGPAIHNRSLCVNETDFYSMDNIKSIAHEQFYSYKDKDGMIYGFDIKSLYQMFLKGTKINNPYNRNDLPEDVKKDIKKIIKLSKGIKRIAKCKVPVVTEEDVTNLTPLQHIESRVLDIFQIMDMMDFCTNTDWFLSLSRLSLIKFIRDLYDIWNYRANLSFQIKKKICPPYGNPYTNINIGLVSTYNQPLLQNAALNIIEKLVKSGVDMDSRYLGSSYVLCGLTLVNIEARNTLPWLYESVCES